ncbi:MAG: biotin/lipoyl-binding carrier protein [Frankia sp.]
MAFTTTAEIVGTVLEVLVGPGDHVNIGDPLVVLESMKMEIPVLAEVRGTVTDLRVTKGGKVAEGQPILVIVDP